MSGPVRAPRRPLSPAAKARLATEIVVTYARVRRSMADGDVRVALERLRGQPAPAQPDPAAREVLVEGVALGRAVTRTLRVLPADSRCLMRSLVLTNLLARRGIESSLVLGVRPGESFAAHAWVEHDSAPLLDPGDFASRRLATL